MFRNSLTWFVITQIILSLFILFVIEITTPNPFFEFYQPRQGSYYIALNSLLFLPVYLITGFILGKIFSIDARIKPLISTTVIAALSLTVLFVIVSIMNDHSCWTLYAIFLNAPHGYSMWGMSHSSDYKSLAGLLFTIAPSVLFTFGIYLQRIILKKHTDVNQ